MNKKELIEKIEALPDNVALIRPYIDKELVLGLVRQLDEPQKIKVPHFVADWIEECEAKEKTLINSLIYTPEGVNSWVGNSDNQETFALAWIFGYEVEEEKRYLVKVKSIKESFAFLNYSSSQKTWFLSDKQNGLVVKSHHTRKELEEAGFCEVFNSPLFEVEEVTE